MASKMKNNGGGNVIRAIFKGPNRGRAKADEVGAKVDETRGEVKKAVRPEKREYSLTKAEIMYKLMEGKRKIDGFYKQGLLPTNEVRPVESGSPFLSDLSALMLEGDERILERVGQLSIGDCLDNPNYAAALANVFLIFRERFLTYEL